MKKIKIELTEEQLSLISQSLDFYSRVGAGQFDKIKDHPTFDKNIYKICTPKKDIEVGDRTSQGEVLEIKDNKALISGSIKDGKYSEEHAWITLKDVKLSTDFNQYHFTRDIVDKHLYVARNILYGEVNYHKNEHWGINNYNVDETCRKAYDIHQDIRHHFWKNSENRTAYTVDSSVHYSSVEYNPLKIISV